MNYYKNNAFSVLASSITSGETAITLAAGTGSRFPAGDFLVTLIGYDGSGNENAWEIVRCTSRAGDILTVARAQEGTTATAWPSAARIENRVTAAAMEALQDKNTFADAAPESPVNGQAWVDGATGIEYKWLEDGTSGQWVETGPGGVLDFDATTAANVLNGVASKSTPVDADRLSLLDSAASWALKTLTFENLKTWIGGLFVSKTAAEVDGDLNFSGTGRRITGDFSNATIADRAMFQTTAGNSNTTVSTIPSGSATSSGFLAFNNTIPTNASEGSLLATPTDVRVSSAIRGTGSFLPLTFYTSGLERLRIDTSGNVGVGTSTPSVKMQVRSPTACQLYVTEDSTGITAQMSVSIAGAIYGSLTNDIVQIRTNNVERLRIDTRGGVGIGKSADTGVKLDVFGRFQLASGADGGLQVFKYTTQNAASRSWRMANDISAYGDFKLQKTTTQDGITFTDVLSVNEVSGDVLIHSGALGYGVGSGGTASQPGQNGGNQAKNLPVTLNKPSGQITMGNAALAAGAKVQFTISNSLVANTDLAVVGLNGNAVNTANYEALCVGTIAGGIVVNLRNTSAGSLSDAVQINFQVIKGATS